jgi:hypothetical protein
MAYRVASAASRHGEMEYNGINNVWRENNIMKIEAKMAKWRHEMA